MIRPATVEDVDQIAALIGAAIATLCRADHHDQPTRIAPWVAANDPAAIAARLRDPCQRLFVAQAGGLAAVGGLDWRNQPPNRGRVSLLFVAPKVQGQGHARAVLAALEAELIALRRPDARLTATNTALGFYRAQGWHPEDSTGRSGALLGHALRKTLI